MNHPVSRSFGRGDVAIIVGSFLWAIGAVVIKNAIEDVDTGFRIFVFNGLRMPLVSLLMFAWAARMGLPVGIRLKDVPIFAFASFLGMFLFMVLNLNGLALTTVSNFAILMATIPLFILLLSFFLRLERISIWTALGIAVGLSGMIALNWRGGGIVVQPGDLLILASCACWAVFAILCKNILRTYPPMIAMAWILLFASFFQLPLMFHELPSQSFTSITTANWINFLIATVVSLFGGNLLFYYALHEIGPTRVGAYSYLEPVFTLFLAAILRGEHISISQAAGLFLIFAGIALTHFRRRGGIELPV
jgi:drug/metabolite transporter (DMT)-like permease